MMLDYDYMRNRMIDVLTKMSRMDVKNAPNYRMSLALRDAFVAYGVPQPAAELLVAAMKINVSENAVNDAELMRRVCEAFGVLVGDMYQAIKTDFQTNPDQMLAAMAGHLSLDMNF